MTRSVGGAAAQGILGGWEMMQRSQDAEDARKQRAFENQRQSEADYERRQQTTRENARQDKTDAEKETDRQISAAEVGQAQARDEFAQAAKTYGGVEKIPQDVADDITGRLQKHTSMVNDLHMQRLKPYTDQKEAWAKDTMSRLAAGQQVNMPRDQLKEALEIATGRPLSDYVRGGANPDGTPAKSKVGQAIDNCTAAQQTNNKPMLIKACSTLMEPDLRKNLGGVAPDGSTIIDKQLHALVPAYQNPAAASTPTPPPSGTQGAIGAASAIPAPQTDAVTAGPTTPAAGPGGSAANPSPQPQQGAVASAVAPQPAPTATPLPGTPAVQPGNAPTAPLGGAAPTAPAPLQPHTDPNLVMPVLDVATVHPADGVERTYLAPVTTDRQPGGPIAPPLKISDMMTRMGQQGTLEAWMNQPEQQDLRDMASKGPGNYMKVFLAAHGHPEDLRADVADYGKGSVGETAAAVEKYAKAHTGGDLAKAHDELVSMGAITPKAAPGSLPPKGYQFQPDGTLKPITGGPADPAVLKTDSQAKARAEGEKAPSGYQWKDGSKTELEPIKGGPHDPASQHGQMGAREAVFLNRTLTSANEAVRDLENIVRLPITVSSGIFGGRKQGPGLFDATKEVLANEMTPDEVRSYNIRAAGFHRSLAGIESAGLAPSGQLSNQMDQVIIKQGDTQFNKLEKFAQTRQIVEAGLETTMSNPKLSDDQRAHAQQIIDAIRKAVPFTMADLDKLHGMQEGAPNATLTQVIKQNKLNKPTKAATASFASESEAQAAADAGKLPSGTKITIGGVPGTWH